MHKDIKLSIIMPCYNESELIESSVSRILTYLNTLEYLSKDSFIMLVDDGSTDETWSIIERLSSQSDFVKGVKLSSNKGHQNALLAGMEQVSDKCDCLISIDADLQQDERAIEKFIKKFSSGCEVVLGVRNDRKTDNFLKKISALGFYKFMNIMGAHTTKNHADYRLLSNRANNALLEFKEVNLFLRGLVGLIGFKTEYVYFDVSNRTAGESKYTLLKMIALAVDGITSFSVTPLRLISLTGFLLFLFSFIMSFYILIVSIFTDNVVPGWASTVLPIYFIGGVQILSIGVLGEYVGKIYQETKQRPRYLIERKTKGE